VVVSMRKTLERSTVVWLYSWAHRELPVAVILATKP